ncbi:MAG TPA: pitrilysin family protein [Pyrinomonadaceae bacterium]|nr:pitrilysin family protein [Pyrinomonadaceae bacterium]
MRLLIIGSLLLCLPLAVAAQRRRGQSAPPPREQKLFPYQYTIDDLPNGLRLVTVPTDYPNLVALYIVVQTGSRNEIEPGKSGYAHFFEHLMFRGSEKYTAEEREAIFKAAGAETNAYTSDDRTVYHATFSKEDLDKIMAMEADRFQRLKYTPEQYKTEAGAVRGEYDKNSASPFSMLYEKLRETAFKKHTYAHTTMGYIKDIEDMPNQFDYSWQFYNRYYRPEYTTIVVVGDVKRDELLAMTKRYFGDWKRGNYVPEIPAEPEQSAPREAHVDWASPTLPYIAVSFRGPAYSDEAKDKAALDLLASVAFGENSDLNQKLVLQEQKADFISPSFDDQVNGELFSVFSRVKDEKDVSYVRDQILATFKRYTTELIPQEKLDATRSRLRYGLALQMNSSEAIANILAPYVSLRRTPETMNKLFALYNQITPEDVRNAAAKYFVDRSRTVVTLSTKGKGGAE